MPKLSREIMFKRTMTRLLDDRKKYLGMVAKLNAKVEEIDGMFDEFGIQLEAPSVKAGAKAGRTAGKKSGGGSGGRGRRTFAVSGQEMLLAYIGKHGNPSTAELNKQWNKEGRGGKADNALTKMVQAGAIKRVKAKGVRGSQYTLP